MIDNPLPLKVVGSQALRDQISKDIEDLVELAKQKKLKPVLLVVGDVFLESLTAQSLIVDMRLFSWEEEVKNNLEIISQLFYSKKLNFLHECESREGLVTEDLDYRIKIFFDPDEDYLSMTCADPKSKVNKSEQISTADGYSYFKIKFKPEETLVNFVVEKFN